MENKSCKDCGENKSIDNFSKHTNNKDGLNIYCRDCNKDRRNKDKTSQKGRPKVYQTEEEKRRAFLENKKRYQNKKNLDPKFRLISSSRTRISQILKDRNIIRTERPLKLIGCTKEFFIQYIEKLFTEEMNWDNYGKDKYWEIDHIIPCDSFKGDEYEIFHYSNLRPYPISDNRKKSNK